MGRGALRSFFMNDGKDAGRARFDIPTGLMVGGTAVAIGGLAKVGSGLARMGKLRLLGGAT